MNRNESKFLYLTTTGRKSGLPREIEIWFVEHEGQYYILAEHFHRAHWVRNIERNPRVRVRVDGRERGATARVLDPERDREAWQRVQELAREKYGWGEGLPVEITPASAH
ncbi:MAG TPA: nitroreductase family deazaflavin-dependent oxidoreductase [Terriglobia bacterium]|nr:nitroreductase family deazaflavin-dependent oxidoreductase [Terriglobia bacterium]